MSIQRILAFSSSRSGNSAYLETAVPVIKDFLGDHPLTIAFLPFASVDNDYEAYTGKVREGLAGLPHTIKVVTPGNAQEVIEQSDVVMVGGGNTFKLLHNLYELNLMEVIKRKVQNGTPYIGWSAGSNITGLTIGTTNDMPVIQPQSFTAFGFFPFQINPHYYNMVVEGFNGETRDQRLDEYLKMNAAKSVIGLPEGTALISEKSAMIYIGQVPGILLYREEEKLIRRELQPGTDLSALLKH